MRGSGISTSRQNLTLALALICLLIWILGGFVVPVGAGWIHLFLGAAMVLLVRRVVVGRSGR